MHTVIVYECRPEMVPRNLGSAIFVRRPKSLVPAELSNLVAGGLRSLFASQMPAFLCDASGVIGVRNSG